MFNFPICLIWDKKYEGNSGMSHGINTTVPLYIKRSKEMEKERSNESKEVCMEGSGRKRTLWAGGHTKVSQEVLRKEH